MSNGQNGRADTLADAYGGSKQAPDDQSYLCTDANNPDYETVIAKSACSDREDAAALAHEHFDMTCEPAERRKINVYNSYGECRTFVTRHWTETGYEAEPYV